LGSKAPLQAMKDWHKLKPKLFKKQPYYLPGCDNYCVTNTSERVVMLILGTAKLSNAWDGIRTNDLT